MSEDLEELVDLYRQFHESGDSERDKTFRKLEQVCKEVADRNQGTDWKKVYDFAKVEFLKRGDSEDRRKGRKRPKR